MKNYLNELWNLYYTGAEGASRQNPKEFVQFLYISLGSLSEVETQVILSKRLKFVENINEILDKIISIKRMLNGLIRYVKEGIKWTN